MGQMLRKRLPGNGFGLQRLGQALGALGGAIGNKHAGDPLIDEVARRQFGSVSGPKHHDGALLQTFKDFFGQFHRRIAHRHRMITNAGLAAHRLGHAQGPLEQLAKDGARAPGRLRRQIRGLHLPENLWLAQHQGVQTRGHAKQVAHRLRIAPLIEMGGKLRRRHIVTRRKKGDATGHAGLDVVGLHVDFDAITGREDDQLLHLWRGKMRQGLRQGASEKARRSRTATGAVV